MGGKDAQVYTHARNMPYRRPIHAAHVTIGALSVAAGQRERPVIVLHTPLQHGRQRTDKVAGDGGMGHAWHGISHRSGDARSNRGARASRLPGDLKVVSRIPGFSAPAAELPDRDTYVLLLLVVGRNARRVELRGRPDAARLHGYGSCLEVVPGPYVLLAKACLAGRSRPLLRSHNK